MAILTGSAGTLDASAIVVRIPGLPDFNVDRSMTIQDIDGWYGAPAPRAELVANGGGPGAVAVGSWDPEEKFYVLSGTLIADDRRAVEQLRSVLLAGLPPTADVPVQVFGGISQQVFVRRYDAPSMTPIGPRKMQFQIPVVAPDPYKYGLEELVATAGAFENEDWHRLYLDDGAGDWYRTYGPDGAEHYRAYETEESETSDQNRVAAIDSPGTRTSRRLTTTITGPLTAGDWFMDNVETGERTWVEVSLAAGESVVLDTANWSTTLQGSPADHLMFGEFPTLRPGTNSWRLITNGASGGGHMTIRALEAYE